MPLRIVTSRTEDLAALVNQVPRWAAEKVWAQVDLGLETITSRRNRRERESRVYFARSGDLIKIGFARDPAARIRDMQIGSATPIDLLGTIPGGRKIERRLHSKFRYIHERGEWFRATPSLLKYIAENAE